MSGSVEFCKTFQSSSSMIGIEVLPEVSGARLKLLVPVHPPSLVLSGD